jgi:hypothetical protein
VTATTVLDLDEGTVTVVQLPRAVWDTLVDVHPPAAGEPGGWHPETFPPALIAASIRDYGGTPWPDGAPPIIGQAIWDNWTPDAAEQVWEACLLLSSPRPLAWATARLDRDSRLAVEVAYCATVGLRPSVFAGWDVRDRDLILAAWLRSRTACPGCGVAWAQMDDYAAALDVEQRECVWCTARDQAADLIPADRRHAVHTFVVAAKDG